MQWEEDPLSYEKYLVFDAIVEFSNEFYCVDHSYISIKNLYDFVDDFFSKKYKKSSGE